MFCLAVKNTQLSMYISDEQNVLFGMCNLKSRYNKGPLKLDS